MSCRKLRGKQARPASDATALTVILLLDNESKAEPVSDSRAPCGLRTIGESSTLSVIGQRVR